MSKQYQFKLVLLGLFFIVLLVCRPYSPVFAHRRVCGGQVEVSDSRYVHIRALFHNNSSLVLRFVRDQFDDYRESTIGAAFLTQTVTLDDQTTVKFEIWDTAGQERYKSLAPMYYRNANCAVVVYDITQPTSLEKAKTWIRELQRQADPSIVIALCGNKTDLAARRQVSQEEAKKYADEEGLMWGETSAKSGDGVNDIFTAIAMKLPLTAPPTARAGAGARTPAARAGVDLTKQAAAQGQSDNCNC
ncbi:hypothetical protein AX16_000497 [Volvariella volvacea WC 439]|nr:hypothetical protein AX16_000497 [Volvariella volvacea WC 439]